MAIDLRPGDEEGAAAEKRAAEADRTAEWDEKVLADLMSTPQGRHWVERFLDYCCEGQELYREDGDALAMAKRDGLAKAGRYVRIQIETYCPDRMLQMIRERRSRMARARAALREASVAEAPADGFTPIEALADEQLRTAAAEAAAAERGKRGGKKKD